ncbi:hypothetical protein GJ744_006724 [Endocarpon pusillum]|uniref:Uncharacterized protein n=1 Tax=Endocarpon pusillum TaxID=364733 RepID=A0A8H7E6P7_9EURO|nr:hypothetical protein GJ744_006724 [Endocarpon pusillum]
MQAHACALVVWDPMDRSLGDSKSRIRISTLNRPIHVERERDSSTYGVFPNHYTSLKRQVIRYAFEACLRGACVDTVESKEYMGVRSPELTYRTEDLTNSFRPDVPLSWSLVGYVSNREREATSQLSESIDSGKKTNAVYQMVLVKKACASPGLLALEQRNKLKADSAALLGGASTKSGREMVYCVFRSLDWLRRIHSSTNSDYDVLLGG